MTLLIRKHFRNNLKEKEKRNIRKALKKPGDKKNTRDKNNK
jgi:hypothetical protein